MEFIHPCPEPGDHIQRVTDPDGDLWKRTSKGWIAHGYGGEPIPWGELLSKVKRLVDATGASWEGDPA